jgi:NAD(P)-dependent dehydrogenase (short-subunit alcohol dehydrogenase family)
MGTYILTGGATGIGAAVKQQLWEAGHHVFVIDIQQGDIQADLSKAAERDAAIQTILNEFPEGIDGFIPCAGLGPHVKPHSLVARVNYFAVVAMTQALKPLLEKRHGSIVLVSSNSASMPGLNKDYISALLAGDEKTACELIDTLDGHNAYAGSKYALTTWMRSNNTEYAKAGIRINAVAPGITRTPLTDKVMADKDFGQVMKDFGATVPMGHLGEPGQIANVITFLLSDKAAFVSGSVFFVDGGHDAMLRPNKF